MASTYNYSLFFKGWAQCRLATDPDPDYEPRGVSGYTFALPGEPDMDRIINFQQRKGVVNRSFGPSVGVKVTGGYAFKTSGEQGNVIFESKKEITKGHPLLGAKIDLLDDPMFSSHNSILVYNGYGIVNPFILEVSTKNTKGKEISVSRQFYIDPENPVEDLEKITIDKLSNYIIGIDATSPPLISTGENSIKPKDRINTMGSPNMMYESGILDPVAYRQERLKNLQKELSIVRKKRPINKIKVAALEKRISELEINNPRNRRTIQLGAKVLLPYALNSKNALLNGKKIKAGPTWGIEMWMGGWDADSMCFYIMGTVEISLPKSLIE